MEVADVDYDSGYKAISYPLLLLQAYENVLVRGYDAPQYEGNGKFEKVTPAPAAPSTYPELS